MQIDEIYAKLKEFINLALEDNTISVTEANKPKSPRPNKPFVTIALYAFRHVSSCDKLNINDNGIQRILFTKLFTVSLQAYTEDIHGSEIILNKILNKLYTSLAKNVFQNDMCYIEPLTSVTSNPVALEGKIESRAVLDLEFCTKQWLDDNVGRIRTVEITNETNDETFIVE